ncbi:conserved hypothetical protein [Vibrio crassostreae]|nr:conserved hypothetical protein [Vibrio crassostreae]CAK2334914.1 conserved hypothetical protein [Vibrio crassostreae]CAK2503251.1 conserved hypothetical protein [Vibrio crassostreae]CAK2911847.1 conserved hypothetical protein [Vibrio crassostreae]
MELPMIAERPMTLSEYVRLCGRLPKDLTYKMRHRFGATELKKLWLTDEKFRVMIMEVIADLPRNGKHHLDKSILDADNL